MRTGTRPVRRPMRHRLERMQAKIGDYRMQMVRADRLTFVELGRRLKCDEIEAEARYEQWLTNTGLREMDDFFRDISS